mmetsp:Transcript_101793/g.185813  ORF Transcript_101793/g.185813 Transcript_101793/m.185813 type:complete len:80 (+) Transcript_101793:385-624(+)
MHLCLFDWTAMFHGRQLHSHQSNTVNRNRCNPTLVYLRIFQSALSALGLRLLPSSIEENVLQKLKMKQLLENDFLLCKR